MPLGSSIARILPFILVRIELRTLKISVQPLAIGIGRQAEMLFEGSCEMTLIEEACLQSDIGKWHLRTSQERHRLSQPAAHQILPRRASERLSKGSCEINRVHSDLLRHFRNLQMAGAPVVQQIAGATYP